MMDRSGSWLPEVPTAARPFRAVSKCATRRCSSSATVSVLPQMSSAPAMLHSCSDSCGIPHSRSMEDHSECEACCSLIALLPRTYSAVLVHTARSGVRARNHESTSPQNQRLT